MLFLTKNRLPCHPMENGNIHPHKRANFVLERNHEILKSLMNNQPITPFKPKGTMSAAWKRDIHAIPFGVGDRVVEDKLRKKTSKQTFENVSWNKLYDFSQAFSDLTKKMCGFPREKSYSRNKC